MTLDHETLTAFAKTYGLIYMMIVFFGALIYALWPANQSKFDKAASSILEEDENQ
ncbi:MAG TPA: cbb3-type cytochrome c oxidase subunit 3 [Parvularculaceae bacterium]|nr:cbb3-type cytochrome c oxidase subunit 3 [Parvularculaceae bacterium]